MAAERQHRLDDREFKRLLDELTRQESDIETPGKSTLAEQLDQVALILRHRAAKASSKAHGGPGAPRPGQRALVGDMLMAVPKLEFADCRALALRDVLSRLGKNRQLQEETLAAADPQVARRVAGGERSAHATAGGQAMWGAANQRAVTLYRRATATGIGAPETRSVAEAMGAIGSGIPLPADVRRRMEAVLGVSLEGVRLHTGAVARDAAFAVNAEAFTVGEDIFFPGYDPTSSQSQETLAHEVVHCIQWRQGRIKSTGAGAAVSRPDDPLEREAEREAKSIVARAFHGPVAPTRVPASGRTASNAGRAPTIDRQPAAFPVAMMLGPVSPTSGGFTGSSAMVMRKYGGDGPLDVMSWKIEDRIKDLGRSIEQAPPHIRAIGGEYADLLADNWGWIAAGLGVALGSAAIAKIYPPFAVANRVIQALLAAAGIVGMSYSAVRSVEAFKAHIRQWAITGWNALGKQEEIKKASIELAQAVTSLLAAAAALLSMLVGPMWSFFAAKFNKAPVSTRPIKEVNPRPQLNARGESHGTSGVPATSPGTGGVPATTGHQSSPGPRLIEDQYGEIRLPNGRILVPAGGSPEGGDHIPDDKSLVPGGEINQVNDTTLQLAIEEQLGLPRFSLTTDNNKALSRDVLERITKNYAPKGTREEKIKILRAIELAQAEEKATLSILQLAEKILKGQWRDLGVNTTTFKVFGKGERVRKIVKRHPEAHDADLVEEQPNEKARKQELNRQRTYIRDYIIDKIDILKSSPHFAEYAHLNPTMSPLGSFTIDTTMVVGRTIFDLKGDELTWAESEVDKIVSAARQALGEDADAIDDATDNFRFHPTEKRVVSWFDPVKVDKVPPDIGFLGKAGAEALRKGGLGSLGINWAYVQPSRKLTLLVSSDEFWRAIGGPRQVAEPRQRALAVKVLYQMLSAGGARFQVIFLKRPVDEDVRMVFGKTLSRIVAGDLSEKTSTDLIQSMFDAKPPPFAGGAPEPGEPPVPIGKRGKGADGSKALTPSGSEHQRRGVEKAATPSGRAPWLFQPMAIDSELCRAIDALRTNPSLRKHERFDIIEAEINRLLRKHNVRRVELDVRNIADPAAFHAPTWTFIIQTRLLDAKTLSTNDVAHLVDLVAHELTYAVQYYQIMRSGNLSKSSELDYRGDVVQSAKATPGHVTKEQRSRAQGLYDQLIEGGAHHAQNQAVRTTYDTALRESIAARQAKAGDVNLKDQALEAAFQQYKALPEEAEAYVAGANAKAQYLAFVRNEGMTPVTGPSNVTGAWVHTVNRVKHLSDADLASELLEVQNNIPTWAAESTSEVSLTGLRDIRGAIKKELQGRNAAEGSVSDLTRNIYIYTIDLSNPTERELKVFVAQELPDFEQRTVEKAIDRMRVWILLTTLKDRLANEKRRNAILDALNKGEYQPPPFAGGAPEPGEPPKAMHLGNESGRAANTVESEAKSDASPPGTGFLPIKTNVLIDYKDKDIVDGHGKWDSTFAVKVNRNSSRRDQLYNRSNRGIEMLRYFYPDDKIAASYFVGLKVLDLAMGGGKFVREMRAKGIEIYGGDIVLGSDQADEVYRGPNIHSKGGLLLTKENSRGYFLRMDASDTKLGGEQFDVIQSTYAMFAEKYDLGEVFFGNQDHQFLISVLREVNRLLKPEGVFRISPIDDRNVELLSELVNEAGGLRIQYLKHNKPNNDGTVTYAEIRKSK